MDGWGVFSANGKITTCTKLNSFEQLEQEILHCMMEF